MAETKIPAIYRVPSNTEPDLKRYLESVQEALEVRLGRRGDELDQAVTYRDLIDSNLAQRASRLNRVIEPMTQNPTPSMPFNTTPQNVQADGAFTKILVTWDDHQMGSLFARAEIWRSGVNDLNAAQLQSSVYGSVWTDTVDYNTTMYYWVRFVQRPTGTGGDETFGAFSDPAASATTAANVTAVMTTLSEQISALPGFTSLNSTITAKTEVIKATSAPGTRSGGSALQASDIWIDTDDNNQAYVRNSNNNGWEKARDGTLKADVDAMVASLNSSNSRSDTTLTASIAAERAVRVSAESNLATASSVTTVSAAVAAKTDVYRASSAPSGGTYVAGDLWIDTDDNQMYQWNGSAWASARDSGLATASALSVVEASATTANNLAGTKVKTFRQNGIPTSLAIGDMWFDTNDSNKMYIAEAVGADAVTSGEWVLAADAIVNSAGASITALSTAITNLQGDADASYVLQVNANGAVAGMVIESTAQGSSSSSSIAFQADQFSIWDGSGATSDAGNRTAPFIVDSGTVYIASAMIQDAAITNAKIANATIESAKIITLEAAKIRSGTFEASTVIKVGSSGSGATDQRIEISAAANRILVVDDSS
jgi:hypothetical protein